MDNQSWTKSSEWLDWFYNGAAEVAKAAGVLPADYQPSGELTTDDAMLRIVGDFMAAGKVLSDYTTPKDAASAFKVWARGLRPSVKPELPQTVRAEIERDFGGVKVRFAWSGVFDIHSKGELTAAFEYAADQVERAFASFGAGAMPKLSEGSKPGGSTERFLGERIVTELKDGKKYHKVMGGKWVKFGVRIWPETLRQADINPDDLTASEPYQLGREVIITLDGDKPLKVINVL